MKFRLAYVWWFASVVLIGVIGGIQWAVGYAAIAILVELLFLIINKYFGSLIDMFGSPILENLVTKITDYKAFWGNFMLRICIYTVALVVVAVINSLLR